MFQSKQLLFFRLSEVSEMSFRGSSTENTVILHPGRYILNYVRLSQSRGQLILVNAGGVLFESEEEDVVMQALLLSNQTLVQFENRLAEGG